MRFLNWVSFLTPARDVRGSEHSAMELSFYFNWLSTTVLLSCKNCWRKLPSYVSTYCLHGISEYFTLFARFSQSFDVLVSALRLIVSRKFLAIPIKFFLECKIYVHCWERSLFFRLNNIWKSYFIYMLHKKLQSQLHWISLYYPSLYTHLY